VQRDPSVIEAYLGPTHTHIATPQEIA